MLGAMRKAGFSCDDVKDLGSSIKRGRSVIKMLARWVFSTQLWATYATGRGWLDGGLREGEGQLSCSI